MFVITHEMSSALADLRTVQPRPTRGRARFYNGAVVMLRSLCGTILLIMATSAAWAQTPQPFPRPGSTSQAPRPATPPAQTPPPQTPPPQSAAAPAPPPSPQTSGPTNADAPTAAALGFPIYPTAQYITSYDAGRGQRYYIFGTAAPYPEVVAFYRTQLRDKGDQVFDQPPTYMFSIGRYREETMAFPPGVTVKDWTWGGSQGYLNPKRGAEPARFPTIVMIVPAPPVAAPPQR
jgi:hypothetical protein